MIHESGAGFTIRPFIAAFVQRSTGKTFRHIFSQARPPNPQEHPVNFRFRGRYFVSSYSCFVFRDTVMGVSHAAIRQRYICHVTCFFFRRIFVLFSEAQLLEFLVRPRSSTWGVPDPRSQRLLGFSGPRPTRVQRHIYMFPYRSNRPSTPVRTLSFGQDLSFGQPTVIWIAVSKHIHVVVSSCFVMFTDCTFADLYL